MDTKTLTDALRSLETESYTWKFALYSISKSRDGIEMEWNLCNMRGIPTFAGRLREYLLKKPVADKAVAPYTPFLSDKESIGAMAQTDELIRDQMSDAIHSIQKGIAYAPEDYVSGAAPKITGYAFFGERAAENGQAPEQVLFMRRGNPFISEGAGYLCTTSGDDVVSCEKPILKFTSSVDFLLIGGVCYLLSSAIKKDFALEDRHFAIAQKCMSVISEAGIVGDYDRFEAVAMKAKNARKFVDFDKTILEHIARLSVADREEFLSTYGVSVDPGGRMSTYEAEQCELIIDLLCCRSCLDPLGRLSVGSNITPRE